LNWPAGDREPTLKQTGGRQGKKGIARTAQEAESLALQQPDVRARKRLRTEPAAFEYRNRGAETGADAVLALLGFEARIGLVDHIDHALAANDLAVAVATLERLKRATDLHGRTSRKLEAREGDQKQMR
jgi:hypothetical protein